jgi:predicted AAA+ superfamily ATPase
MYLQRILSLNELIKKKSFFLFGPRATGKSSLIREQLSDNVLVINLLKSDLFLRLSAEPGLLIEIIATRKDKETIVVIDEVQKIPILLNEVHRLIEEENIRFLLTGSSARKLRKTDTNLLAGRAWEAHLFPLVKAEIPDFSLERYLTYGGLPVVYLSENPREELIAYVDTYLKEEIQAEAVVRKIQSFSRFLQMSALTSGQILNFASLASDTGVAAATIREYYQILDDTLIGFFLSAWTKTKKRKAVSTAKFYFFDVGVMHQLSGIKTVEPNTEIYGQAFEHFIVMELKAYLSYARKNLTLSFWADQNKHEVDFIIGDEVAVEVKTTKMINAKHLKGLKALQEENICKKYFVVSFDKIHRIHEGIEIIFWEAFLDLLWAHKII